MADMKVLDALSSIDPSMCNYEQWVEVGMALKEEGLSVSDWDSWSRKDAARWEAGECEKKWKSFNGSGRPVTGGTIIEMARQNGWTYSAKLSNDAPMDFGDEISIEEKETCEAAGPRQQADYEQLKTYIQTLFRPDETVWYCTKSFKGEDGKYRPSGEHYHMKAGDMLRQLDHYHSLPEVVGDWDPDAGAWIRFNPFDNSGFYKDENITAYRYALAESDSLPIEEQYRVLRESRLPIAVLVESGGKSLHAVFRVDAKDKFEYASRVRDAYASLNTFGFLVDPQNKNPSRLSRMPGVTRNGNVQKLIATNIGCKTWEDWQRTLRVSPLPEIVSLGDRLLHPLDMPPELIKGVLRESHKMLVAGPSKAGKSFLLMELCIAFAEGQSWMGFECEQCKVLYVNLEIDEATCEHRFIAIYEKLGFTKDNWHAGNIQVLPLRGQAKPLDDLVPQLIDAIKDQGYKAVIIDPIYKVITGDENNASDMGHFCNQFDRLCQALGCAVIYCHHHSKGAQGQKKAQDRASGSGVFARDPDALIDIIEIEKSEDEPMAFGESINVDSQHGPAFRMDFSLREFASPKPVCMWFDYPCHVVDTAGVLDGALADGEEETREMKAAKRQKKMSESRLIDAYAGRTVLHNPKLPADKGCPISVLAEEVGVTDRTLRNFFKEHTNNWRNDKGTVYYLGDLSGWEGFDTENAQQ